MTLSPDINHGLPLVLCTVGVADRNKFCKARD